MTSLRQARASGKAAGFNMASWINCPADGATVYTECDGRVVIGPRDCDGTLSPWDYVANAAAEAEGNARQYAEFSHLAAVFNADESRSESLWFEYDRGVESGIAENIRQRKRALRVS